MEKWWQKSVVYQIYPKSFLDSNAAVSYTHLTLPTTSRV